MYLKLIFYVIVIKWQFFVKYKSSYLEVIMLLYLFCCCYGDNSVLYVVWDVREGCVFDIFFGVVNSGGKYNYIKIKGKQNKFKFGRGVFYGGVKCLQFGGML